MCIQCNTRNRRRILPQTHSSLIRCFIRAPFCVLLGLSSAGAGCTPPCDQVWSVEIKSKPNTFLVSTQGTPMTLPACRLGADLSRRPRKSHVALLFFAKRDFGAGCPGQTAQAQALLKRGFRPSTRVPFSFPFPPLDLVYSV